MRPPQDILEPAFLASPPQPPRYQPRKRIMPAKDFKPRDCILFEGELFQWWGYSANGKWIILLRCYKTTTGKWEPEEVGVYPHTILQEG